MARARARDVLHTTKEERRTWRGLLLFSCATASRARMRAVRAPAVR